jgi:uridine phosphorylase
MSKFLKIVVAAAAVMASGVSLSFAGDMPACQSSGFTPHGIWDCR